MKLSLQNVSMKNYWIIPILNQKGYGKRIVFLVQMEGNMYLLHLPCGFFVEEI